MFLPMFGNIMNSLGGNEVLKKEITGVLQVYIMVALPVHSLCFMFVVKDVISHLPALDACSPNIVNSPSRAINKNHFIFP